MSTRTYILNHTLPVPPPSHSPSSSYMCEIASHLPSLLCVCLPLTFPSLCVYIDIAECAPPPAEPRTRPSALEVRLRHHDEPPRGLGGQRGMELRPTAQAGAHGAQLVQGTRTVSWKIGEGGRVRVEGREIGGRGGKLISISMLSCWSTFLLTLSFSPFGLTLYSLSDACLKLEIVM